MVGNKHILVIGTGGIGCELLKCLAYSGFQNIDIIDKDTIELSNLNRQFLFRCEDIGKSKSEVCSKRIKEWFKNIKMKHYFNDIMSLEYDTSFYKKYELVINALDNRESRSHVNRMCLASNVPLIDSGSTGYLGQITIHIKGVTECYDCNTHEIPNTYPICTIRSNPSKYSHCVIWGKNIFDNLFNTNNSFNDDAEIPALLNECDRGYGQLFKKLFVHDINELLKSDILWKEKILPIVLCDEYLKYFNENDYYKDILSKINEFCYSKELLDISTCLQVLSTTLNELLKKKSDCSSFEYDKNCPLCVCFVGSVANIRAHQFHIDRLCFYDSNTIAGNIVPAIATTNDIISSLITIQAIKVLTNSKTNDIYLSQKPICDKIIIPQNSNKPNPACYMCSFDPQTIYLNCNTLTFTVKELKYHVIQNHLGITLADVIIDDKSGSILISSEYDETAQNMNKTLNFFHINNGSKIKVENFISNYYLYIIIHHKIFNENKDFEISSEPLQEVKNGDEFDFKPKKRKNMADLD